MTDQPEPESRAVIEAHFTQLSFRLGFVFTPSAPISSVSLFAGRSDKIRDVIAAVRQPGQHVVLFGERGVGKTSLASVIHDLYVDVSKDFDFITPRVNCDTNDRFETIWTKVADAIESLSIKQFGKVFWPDGPITDAFEEIAHDGATPHTVRRFLDIIGKRVIIIIDEFDRVDDDEVKRLMADTIKGLSDHIVNATLIIVGVAVTVEDLIAEHESVSRAIVQVFMPRMSILELEEVLDRAYGQIGMTTTQDAKTTIARLSQGLPHYTHLLGLHAGLSAVDNERDEVQLQDVHVAALEAIDKAPETLSRAFHLATRSPKRANLYRSVLLACAVSQVDELGYFAAGDIRGPLGKIAKKPMSIPSFYRYLNDLCEVGRGEVLEKLHGPRPRYRFRNPLLKPHVLLQGMKDSLIDGDALQHL